MENKEDSKPTEISVAPISVNLNIPELGHAYTLVIANNAMLKASLDLQERILSKLEGRDLVEIKKETQVIIDENIKKSIDYIDKPSPESSPDSK